MRREAWFFSSSSPPIIYGFFQPGWNGKEMMKKENCWSYSGSLIPGIYLFYFHIKNEFRCSKKYTIVKDGSIQFNMIVTGWNQPEHFQSFITIWQYLMRTGDKCYDELLEFLDKNESFPIDLVKDFGFLLRLSSQLK